MASDYSSVHPDDGERYAVRADKFDRINGGEKFYVVEVVCGAVHRQFYANTYEELQALAEEFSRAVAAVNPAPDLDTAISRAASIAADRVRDDYRPTAHELCAE